jgi:hypothetical protein
MVSPSFKVRTSKLAHPIVLRTVAGLSHGTKTGTVAVGLAGNLIEAASSTKAAKIVDKSVLWKPCGAGVPDMGKADLRGASMKASGPPCPRRALRSPPLGEEVA